MNFDCLFMINFSKKTETKPGFRELMPDYTDAQIISILKKRSHYHSEAVKMAVDEAIKRGIIHSEQDLWADEFREKEEKNTMFPIPENEIIRQRLKRSINRALIFSGLVPIIKGVILLTLNNIAYGVPFLVFGLIWIFASVLLYVKPVKWYLYVLYTLFPMAAAFAVYYFLTEKFYKPTDVFAVVITLIIIGYGLIFLHKLINLPDDTN